MRSVITLVMGALLFTAALSQPAFSTGGEPQRTKAWEQEQFKLDPDKRIKLTFRNANIDRVLELFSRESGITILSDPKLTDKVTIITPSAISLADAFEVLDAKLGLMNFQLEASGKLLVIKARRSSDRGGMGDMTPEQLQAMMGGNRPSNTELIVYPITYASASEVARIVNEVFTTQEQQNNPFAAMMSFGRGRSSRWGGSRGSSGAPSGSSVRASSDDFSNTVIVNAPKDKHLHVAVLIEQIDVQTESPQLVRVYPLEYAFADELAPTVQSVLAANETTGRGNRGGGDFMDRMVRLSRGVTDGGSVVADSRTNSLVITATDKNHDIIAQVVDELDHDVPYVSSTFVFPIENARSDDIADLLNQAFGQQRGNNRGNSQNRFSGGNRNNRGNNSNRGGNSGRGGGFGGRAVEDDPDNLYLEFENADDEYGDLYTYVQFRGGTSFGGQNNQSRGQQGTLGGRVTNIQQAQGNVTIISDPQTNSLIVVGEPDAAEMIRSILEQLDKIPEQVMIETIIVEATLDASMKLGVEWNMVTGKFIGRTGVTGSGQTDFGIENQNPAAQGFRYGVTGGNIGGFLNALETDERFQVLSTPRIFTSNNVEASINISQSVPFIVSQREDVNGNFIFNYSFQDVGIVLTVTPRITANGMVTLDVVQTANDLQGFTDFNAPIVNQREASTTVSVRDGHTIVLGGIMRTTVRSTVKKIPILGDIPILGELFKSRELREVKTELLVFLTPRIVKNDQDAESLKNDQINKMSDGSQKNLQKLLPPKTGGDDKNNGGAGGAGGTGGSGGNK